MKLLRLLTGIGTLVAGLLGGLYLWSLLSGEHDADAVAVTLVFDSVQGLHEGAAIQYRGVRVGEVRQIRLGGGGDAAEVLCSFEPWARSTLRVTSRFWIVRPRFLGVVRGVSGLETLVKDSYVTYSSPTGSALLPMHARLPGLTTPPEGTAGSALPAPHPGDLEITVVFSDSRGLEAGDPVRHRGLRVGVVSSVELARDAGGVVVAARIDRRYRRAVTDESRFWVARPSIHAGWIRGLDVHDIDALLAGAYLTFYTPERPSAAPSTDGSVFVGELERPDFDWQLPDATQVGDDGGTMAPAPTLSAHLVRVHYTFERRRWYGSKQKFRRESPGVIYRTADGVAAVLVVRSGVDAEYWSEGKAAKGSLDRERVRVQMADGSVLDAGRVWTAEDDADLALVRVVDERAAVRDGAPVAFAARAGDEVAVEVLAPGEDDRMRRVPATLAADGTLTGVDATLAGGLLLARGVAIGVVGRNGPQGLAAVSFARVPESLRARAR